MDRPKGNPQHGKRGSRERAALRCVQSFDLRRAGWSYRAIGEKLGISAAQAFRYVARGLDELATKASESAGELRKLELHRLDRLQSGLWSTAAGGDPKSAAVVIKLMERRSKLLGLDARERVDLTTDGKPLSWVVSVSDGRVSCADEDPPSGDA